MMMSGTVLRITPPTQILNILITFAEVVTVIFLSYDFNLHKFVSLLELKWVINIFLTALIAFVL
jgi:hypothetical protein